MCGVEKKIKIKCAKCGTVNKIPYTEASFRIDKDNRTLCHKCCKEFRWESKVCKKCSDRKFCNGSFMSDAKKFISKLSGV